MYIETNSYEDFNFLWMLGDITCFFVENGTYHELTWYSLLYGIHITK